MNSDGVSIIKGSNEINMTSSQIEVKTSGVTMTIGATDVNVT